MRICFKESDPRSLRFTLAFISHSHVVIRFGLISLDKSPTNMKQIGLKLQ